MPWTPMAVRAWRTSSSLNGLMIATTSFMDSGLHFPGYLAVWLPGGGCQSKSGIFLCKWHKKVAGLRENIRDRSRASLYRRPDRPSECGFAASGAAGPAPRTRSGGEMSNRSWFYASEGQQLGPYPEAQLRDLIGRGSVRADTLVWTEGMAGWQKAAEIPGVMSGPPSIPQAGGPPVLGGRGGGTLSIDVGLWPLLGRSLLYIIGLLLVIPAPWVATSFYRWAVSRLHVPGRPNLAFNGQVGDLWYVFVLMGLMSYAGFYDTYVQLLLIPVQAFLSWMLLR